MYPSKLNLMKLKPALLAAFYTIRPQNGARLLDSSRVVHKAHLQDVTFWDNSGHTPSAVWFMR